MCNEDISVSDLMEQKSRSSLAKLVMRLFDRWGIDVQAQCRLLGLETDEDGLAALAVMRDGGSLPADTAMIERVGDLLAIHRNLAILYGAESPIRFRWISDRNKRFMPKPLDYILEGGDEGLTQVRMYLDFLLVR